MAVVSFVAFGRLREPCWHVGAARDDDDVLRRWEAVGSRAAGKDCRRAAERSLGEREEAAAAVFVAVEGAMVGKLLRFVYDETSIASAVFQHNVGFVSKMRQVVEIE